MVVRVVFLAFLVVAPGCRYDSDCTELDVGCSAPLMMLAFAPISRGRGVYTANGAAQNISTFRIDFKSSTFLPASSGTIATPGSTRGIAIDSNRSLLYVSEIVTPSMMVYSLNRDTAAAVMLRSQVISTPGNRMAIDPTGRFLYAISGTQVQAYVTDGLGSVAALAGLVSGMTSSQGGIVDSRGLFLYVPDLGYNLQEIWNRGGWFSECAHLNFVRRAGARTDACARR